MKKTMSIISALALVVAMLCTMNITAFAGSVTKTTTFDFSSNEALDAWGGEDAFEDAGHDEEHDEDMKSAQFVQDGFTFDVYDDNPYFRYYDEEDEYLYDTYLDICGCYTDSKITAPEGKKITKVTVYLANSNAQYEGNNVYYAGLENEIESYIDEESGELVIEPYSYAEEDEDGEYYYMSFDGEAVHSVLDVDAATETYTCEAGASEFRIYTDYSGWSTYINKIEVEYAEFTPEIIDGADQKVKVGADASFRSDAELADFEKVLVDGAEVDAANYTLTEGSTIVTLKAYYVKTLSVGKHTIDIVSTTGTASTEFTVEEAETQKDDSTKSPATGATMGIAALTAGLGLLVVSRKKD